MLVPDVALDEGLKILEKFGEGGFIPVVAEEGLVRALKRIVRFGDFLQGHLELMNTSTFRGLDVGVETVSFPEVLEILELLVVLLNVFIGVARWGGISCNLGTENLVDHVCVLLTMLEKLVDSHSRDRKALEDVTGIVADMIGAVDGRVRAQVEEVGFGDDGPSFAEDSLNEGPARARRRCSERVELEGAAKFWSQFWFLSVPNPWFNAGSSKVGTIGLQFQKKRKAVVGPRRYQAPLS